MGTFGSHLFRLRIFITLFDHFSVFIFVTLTMEKLIKQRASFKGTITRIENFVNKSITDQTVDICDFEVRQTMLNEAYRGYTEVQGNIEDQDDSEEILNDRANIESKFLDLSGLIKRALKQFSDASSSVCCSAPSKGQNSNVKVPELSIPVFNGNFSEWSSFYDLFNALIVDNNQLSNIQKFIYLKSSLKGEPIKLIENLPLTNDNFEIALTTLKKRYNNKLFVINAHLKTLLEFPSISRCTANNLREFITTVNQHIESLKNLNVPVGTWDLVLIYLLTQKLDVQTKQAFEFDRGSSALPKLEDFLGFLEKRCIALENLGVPEGKGKFINLNTKIADHKGNNMGKKCCFCKGTNHHISKCFRFKSLSVDQRRRFISENKLCYKCLSPHFVQNCSRPGCTICNGSHNTLIHVAKGQSNSSKSDANGSYANNIQASSSGTKCSTPVVLDRVNAGDNHHPTGGENANADHNIVQSLSAMTRGRSNNNYVMLATTQVFLLDIRGKLVKATALLDSGAQCSLITTDLVERIMCPTYNRSVQISGISGKGAVCNKMIDITLCLGNCKGATRDNRKISISCSVLDKFVSNLPQVTIAVDKLQIPSDLQLADPSFYKQKSVDILIGADVYYDVITPGIINLGRGLPVLQNTLFGWVIAGRLSEEFIGVLNATENIYNVSLLSNSWDINKMMERFWESEEITFNTANTVENELSETIFKNTTRVLGDGSFQVDMLLKTNREHEKLGDSFTMAKKRFFNLEKRFQRDNNLFLEYKKFIDEYVSLGHAKYVPLTYKNDTGCNKYFLPHHCVIRESSSTTKLRVVFDASMKSSTNFSLNDITLKGYRVQPEIVDILCRFRSFKYVLIVDIEKMYRQIKVDPSQLFLQNILWRDNPNHNLQCIELQTVTYGTKAAPFLATRVLHELGIKNLKTFPLAANTIVKQCYVDDILGGAKDLDALLELKNQLTKLLGSANFNLHKWGSNSKEFLVNCGAVNSQYEIKSEDVSNKILGISWGSAADEFSISMPQKIEACFTKRNVLSVIAQIYDPLGLVAPIVVVAKLIMQEIWLLKLNWDDMLSEKLKGDWANFLESIKGLSDLKIPRWLFNDKQPIRIEIHGFADASLRAYGACVYLRAMYDNTTVSCKLICSKSRVAPLKTLTIPKLELNACLLLSKLTDKVVETYKCEFILNSVNLWTDSQIALCWLKSHPSRWNIFVANRVAQIQDITASFKWGHIRSADNPADFLSRGLGSKEIINNSLWWNGPKQLQISGFDLDYTLKVTLQDIPEERKAVLVVNTEIEFDHLFQKFSCFTKLKRVLGYCLRFAYNSKIKNNKRKGCLMTHELDDALIIILKYLQRKYFHTEMAQIRDNKPLNNRAILSLNPFIDGLGILRVGGRLSNANVNYSQKHPILLPSRNHLVSLMIKHEHLRLYHGGAQTVLSNFRLKFWPLNGLREAKKIIRNCVTCARFNSQPPQQIMADLPKERLTATRAFENVGIDFGGPFFIKNSRTRRASCTKAYIAVFICMVTKCVHLELVTGLSCEAFLLTLKRFISRRGNPTIIYSDNATNFLGAKNQLHELYEFFKNKKNECGIIDFSANKGIQWKFIPPRSPHWGGIWEAAVKSAKFHILRVIGETKLTFEEFSTVLAQIEAILNSRPLCPLSSVPGDFSCLTPGHFLIGENLLAYPEKDITAIPENRLSIWQRCTKIQQHFWKRWSIEYLNQLQNRPKWLKMTENLKIDQIVLLKEDNIPPLRWPLGRITEILPGADGKVRLVKLKTKDGNFTRPIRKVCPLPIEV